jgi:hypothetical protein
MAKDDFYFDILLDENTIMKMNEVGMVTILMDHISYLISLLISYDCDKML